MSFLYAAVWPLERDWRYLVSRSDGVRQSGRKRNQKKFHIFLQYIKDVYVRYMYETKLQGKVEGEDIKDSSGICHSIIIFLRK